MNHTFFIMEKYKFCCFFFNRNSDFYRLFNLGGGVVKNFIIPSKCTLLKVCDPNKTALAKYNDV